MNKDALLKQLKRCSDTNRNAIKALNKKIAEYRLERANRHYWHNKMGAILNRFVANKESHEKAYSFFQKQINDLESGEKGVHLVLQEVRTKYAEFNGGAE